MPLLQTKLHIPPLRTELVSRTRLTDRLGILQNRKLSVISAPAGFGKSTLASCWLAQQNRPVAWVSLDENDNDPVNFLSYAITALHQIAPHIGAAALAMLDAPNLPSYNALLAYLINDLAQSETDFILVFDDYHLIETEEIHAALSFLLDNLPPQLHIVVISRSEPPLPIAKLRAKNQLVELHAADLRFTWAETETFLNQVMRLGLSSQQITQLEAQTEGWITGLQLTALSIKDTADAARLIETFAADNRYIADYLVDEVLSRQPDETQQFLLQTSILDKLCADLCNVTLGIKTGQATLEQLENANLFLIPLDSSRKWYRYHHLFAQLLRTRLENQYPNLVPQLYRRAFDWYHSHDLLEEAVPYALRGKLFDRAADIIEAIGQHIYWHNRGPTLRSWLRVLPEGVLEERPDLQILNIYIQIHNGDLITAERAVNKAQQSLQRDTQTSADAHRVFAGQVAAVTTAVVFHRHLDLTRGEQLAREALALLPPEYHYDRCVAAFHGAGCYILLGKLSEARQYLQEAIYSSDRANNPLARPLILTNLGHLAHVTADLHQARLHYQEAQDVARVSNVIQKSTFSGAVIGLARLHRQWNDTQKATAYLQAGLKMVELDNFFDRMIYAYSVAIELFLGEVELKQARDILQRANHFWTQYNASPKMWQEVHNLEACVAFAEQDIDAVTRWLARFATHPDPAHLFTYSQALVTIVDYFLIRNEFRAAHDWLVEPLATSQQQGYYTRTILLNTLLAKVYQAQGDEQLALTHLRAALSQAQPAGFIRVFLDRGEPVRDLLLRLRQQNQLPADLSIYIQLLISHFQGEPTTITPQPSTQPALLTPRELDVLSHLAAGDPYADIAKKMVITENTLKYHIKNTYGKLAVNNRVHAVMAAQELGLL
jgi:LuxR family maltose regulon positive regulatory protein